MAMQVIVSTTTNQGPSVPDLLLERYGLDVLRLLMAISLQIVEE